MSDYAAAIWDRQATIDDDEPDHGLRDPVVREARWGRVITDERYLVLSHR